VNPVPAALTPRQEDVKARFIEVRGTWSEAWEAVVRLDPDFLEAYLRFSAVPWCHGPLPPKVKEFIYIAIDASATHMYLPGVRQHIKAALDHGATGAEIMEVLELTATLGIHAMNVGMPVLAEVLNEMGRPPAPELDARQREIKEEFTRVRGYWHSSWDETLQFAPELLAAYLEFSGVPWRGGSLEPKVKEFIYIAFDVAATHLYRTGLKIHIANALGYGATPEEITEVMEIAAVLGVHAVTTSAPLLAEELAARAHALRAPCAPGSLSRLALGERLERGPAGRLDVPRACLGGRVGIVRLHRRQDVMQLREALRGAARQRQGQRPQHAYAGVQAARDKPQRVITAAGKQNVVEAVLWLQNGHASGCRSLDILHRLREVITCLRRGVMHENAAGKPF
jgi:alkylhydroperoxidase/carboxymuconolactone decarboxylase family protein YurZ